MKVVIFGAKTTTLHFSRLLSSLLTEQHLVTISPEKAIKQNVAGYSDLSTEASFYKSIYVAERYDLSSNNDFEFFSSFQFDIGFCIGWQRIIPSNILELFPLGVFGMHGSAQDLPFGRGRSPMNWSIIEGRKWFHTNLFKYSAGIDDGPIVDTSCFSVNDFDTAETMHFKNTLAMAFLVKRNIQALSNGSPTLSSQSNAIPTYYPKRSPEDGWINWADDISNIERLIRAVAKPFYGAFGYLNNSEIKILRAGIFYTDLESHFFKNASYGEICYVFENSKFLVRCNGGILLVHCYESDNAKIVSGMIFDKPNSSVINKFPRNQFGFFDLPS